MNQSKGHIDRDCTEKCKSKQHGDEICYAITKRCVSDAELCAYIRWKCFACGQVFDSMGRTALHFAASCGRTLLAKWLIRNKGAQINVRDLESGYSALHKSIFYGKIDTAVSLIEIGANLNLADYNDLTPLDHAMKDRLTLLEYGLDAPCQVYVWGTNSNYTLGTGTQHARQMPELLDAFHRKYTNISIKEVCLDKFHCVLVSTDGKVFSCGHAQGGRLGLNSERTVLIPEEVRFTAPGFPTFLCAKASISRDHSIFLSNSGHVWSCGLNTHYVLGIKPAPAQLLTPKPLTEFRHEIEGICAARYHSVAWGPNGLYTWGLNAGQLGQPETANSCLFPKQVKNFSTENTEIVSVAVSDSATVIGTRKGDVFVLHEYQTRRIASRQVNIDKIVVVGGHFNSKVSNDLPAEKGCNELKVLIIQTTGNLLLWQESCPQLSRCIYTLNRQLIVRDAILSRTEVFFTTDDGEAFKGEFYTRKKRTQNPTQTGYKSAFHEFLDKDDCQTIKVTRFPHIHRAVKIQCDPKGRNFAVLQTDPRNLLLDVPQHSPSGLKEDMLNLLNDSDEMDAVHDVLFKIGMTTFPVHRYIIAMKSSALDSLIEASASQKEIELTNINATIFKQILLYIYTGTCDLAIPGECPSELKSLFSQTVNKDLDICYDTEELFEIDENISAYEYYKKKQKSRVRNKEHNNVEIKDPLRLLQEAAKRFEIKSLQKKLECYTYSDGFIYLKPIKKDFMQRVHFDRLMFKNLHDIVIKSKNGTEISVHKCILAARLEYFNNLFAVRWNDKSRNVITLPIDYDVLEEIINFLYTDEAKNLERCDDIDYIINVLIVSDQLFIDRLKAICEIALSSLLTLRNAAQMLQLANIYNSVQLKNCSMEFICLNLSAILESRSLGSVDSDILNELTEYYSKWNPILSKRMITPFADAPSDEIVKSISNMHPVDVEDSDQDIFDKKPPKITCKKKARARKSSSFESTKNKSQSDVELNNSIESKVRINNSVQKDSIGSNIENKPDEKWIKILTEKEKHQKIIKARLRAIATAKEEIECEKFTYTPTKLVSTPKTIPRNDKRSINSSPLTSPVLIRSPIPQSSNTDFFFEEGRSPPIYDIPIQKAQKLSQKQRKKLAADFTVSSIGQELDKINKKFSWRNSSFEETNSAEIKGNRDVEYADVTVGSPKNPWQKIEVPVLASSLDTKPCFLDIVADEKKQKENWIKMRARPLLYIQMEDRAIRELERFYNIDEVSDEHITIHKVDKATFAVPMWVPNIKH